MSPQQVIVVVEEFVVRGPPAGGVVRAVDRRWNYVPWRFNEQGACDFG